MKFRSRVVEIEAWQFLSHAQFEANAPEWLRDVRVHLTNADRASFKGHVAFDSSPLSADDMLVVGTLEGSTYASPEHWIIRGTEGELYPCKPSVFERKYEAAE
jgi:hypothetical protein